MDFRISSTKLAGASWLPLDEAKKRLHEIADYLENVAVGEAIVVERVV